MSTNIESTPTTQPSTTDDGVVFAADGRVAGTKDTSIDYKLLYESQLEETGRLRAVVDAGRFNPPAVKEDSRKPMTADRLRGLMGPTAWLKSTTEEKLIGLGQNPREVDVDFLKRLFGKGNNGVAAQDLHKSNPFRYRQLREAALVLNVFGK